MLTTITNLIKRLAPEPERSGAKSTIVAANIPILKPMGFSDFLNLDVPKRESLLDPILPARSLSMLYAPRGLGKTLLGLSIGLTVAGGSSLLRWSTSTPRRVLYVDGEMPLASLQERMKGISLGLGTSIPNNGFMILAADHVEGGINLGTAAGQRSLEPLLKDVDLLILDNLSTLCTTGGELASDAWLPMQNWLLKLRRKGLAVLFIHHAGNNGRQRGDVTTGRRFGHGDRASSTRGLLSRARCSI